MDSNRLGAGVLLLCVLLLGQLVTSNVVPQQKPDDKAALDDQDGLYGGDDLVYVLNITNFKTSVHDSGRAWLVQFYNSYCGHCRKFAPFWKALAKSIYGWKDIVAVGAINCANDDNNPLCRDYEIMSYPTIRFFHLRSTNDKDKIGIDMKKDFSENSLRQYLIDQLIKDEQDQEAGLNWPNLVPYRNSEIKTLWEKIPESVQYQFLIFEEPNAYLGADVILDLHKLENTRIRRITSNNLVLTSAFAVKKFPSVIVIERKDKSEHLKTEILTREAIVKVITEFLQSKGISIEIKKDDFDLKHINHVSQDNSKTNDHLSRDNVYQLDLETALRYSLNNEIPLSFNISGEKMTALKTYLKVLVKYFPIHVIKMKTYLEILQDVLDTKSNISGKEFKEQIKLKEKGLAPVYSANLTAKTYIGCKGSKPTFRGYPCGLWTLFHTLTVAAAEKEANNDKDVPSVLTTMHAYVKNFFACAECAQHFQEMAAKRKLFDSRGGDEDVLWLWRAHNEVNERLAGDATEDPEHKKIQYPSAEHCPDCRLSDGKWNEHEVLKYLKAKYSKVNIDLKGISETDLEHEINMNAANSGAGYKKFGWDFTIFDFSICVVLYVVSAALLILVCLKFAYKRTYKKKMSFQNMFGLV
ncbi:sulfhydryl oxidase 2-like [Copidosoma floridanum]|uniref:sulfhydryl oxidase 2-like n=1 Tax=Copidosoma floridanum TaxID=29053 RepID=UPI0006C99D50|nr:sulfhydryl oxidase 2-like [Copidosoma floridanum]